MTSSRWVAFQTLKDVRTKDAYANLALKHKIGDSDLNSRDAAFVTELVAGTLRNQKTYDAIIKLASGRKLKAIDKDVLDILRMGAHQLLNTRVAKHASVNESVKLTKKARRVKASGFVNAVMRKIGAKDLTEWIAEIERLAVSDQQALADVHSHPEWIIASFNETLAREKRENEIRDVLLANNKSPAVSVAALTSESLQLLSEKEGTEGFKFQKRGPSPIGFELASGEPEKEIANSSVTEGTVRVQDQGSQLAALTLVAAKIPVANEKWLDLCAGPGGKTAVLAATAEKFGVQLLANEISPHRAKLVQDSVIAFKNSVEINSADGTKDDAYQGETFDRIMIDAPCSGLGALRRRPEARWRKQESDLQELTRTQKDLLDTAAKHLQTEGLISYVTCSPHLQETREIVESFLAENPDFVELDAKNVLKKLAATSIDLGDSEDLSVQLWPHRHETDAMFIALLQKKKE